MRLFNSFDLSKMAEQSCSSSKIGFYIIYQRQSWILLQSLDLTACIFVCLSNEDSQDLNIQKLCACALLTWKILHLSNLDLC